MKIMILFNPSLRPTKICLLLIILMWQTNSALSQEVGSVVIDKPVHPIFKRFFSDDSDEHGICKSLGYESAVAESLATDQGKDYLVRVDEDGYFVTEESYSHPVTSIACQNKLQDKPLQQIFYIKNPLHPKLNVPYSKLSSVHGVCQSLGYEIFVNGSMKHVRNYIEGAGVTVNMKGKVIRQDSYFHPITEIACIDKQNPKDAPVKPEDVERFRIKSPLHPTLQVPFSRDSHSLGICTLLGYKGFLPGPSKIWDNSYRHQAGVTVDEKGVTIRKDTYYMPITTIYCIP